MMLFSPKTVPHYCTLFVSALYTLRNSTPMHVFLHPVRDVKVKMCVVQMIDGMQYDGTPFPYPLTTEKKLLAPSQFL